MNEVLNRILILLEKQNKRVSELCKFAGIANSTFSTWKEKNREPQIKYIPKIAEFLNVSIDYLLTGEVEDGYYINSEAAEMAQELYERPELRVLFKASRNVSKESIEAVTKMIESMKKEGK